MSDNIPFDLQVQIIKKLPIKSLIQFRSVSKAWKSLIDSSDFIKHYISQSHHLLVRYRDLVDNELKHVSFVDDDTFPQQRVSLTPPTLVNMLNERSNMHEESSIIGSSHGLLCLYGYHHEGRRGFGTPMAVLWNISVRKAVAVVVPYPVDGIYTTALGFGVCREFTDPKVVSIKYISTPEDMESISCIPRQVEVFTLSTGAWRSSYSSNPPRKSIELFGFRVDIDGFLYGLAADRITTDSGFSSCNLIMSFDVTSEEFREVNLPDSLARDKSHRSLFVSKLRKSLVVLENHDLFYSVWMMNDGGPSSFSKIFTICTPHAGILSVLDFRKSGEPVIEILGYGCDGLEDPSWLVVYEPDSEHTDDLRIDGISSFTYCGSSYMETLLLLDQPNFIIYDQVRAEYQ